MELRGNDMQIGKNHSVIERIKELKKHPKDEYYVVEEMFILSLVKKFPCEIECFVYCEELCYSDEAKCIIEFYKATTIK